MKKNILFAALMLVFFVVQMACSNDELPAEDPQCPPADFTFSQGVVPILDRDCRGCHVGSAPSGGIDLSTYASVKERVDDGSLIGSINYEVGFSGMPQGSQLAPCDIEIIENWVNAGAQDN